MAVSLPDHHQLSTEELATLAGEFGLPSGSVQRLPDAGITNAIFQLGEELILRVPRRHPRFEATLRREAVVVPVAVTAGVSCPALVRYDDSLSLLSAPYAIYERVRGTGLEPDPGAPLTRTGAWEGLGRDLAILHGVEVSLVDGLEPPSGALPGAGELIERRLAEGWLSPLDAGWLGEWVRHLADSGGEWEPAVIHGDMQAANVLVGSGGEYAALIDWGDTRVDDPAYDFASVALRVVPQVLLGYVGVTPALRARIVLRQLQFAVMLLPRGAAAGLSWAERPVPMLVEVLRFFTANCPIEWRSLGPPSAD